MVFGKRGTHYPLELLGFFKIFRKSLRKQRDTPSSGQTTIVAGYWDTRLSGQVRDCWRRFRNGRSGGETV